MKQALKAALRENRGSGIVMVLVSMLFVTLLGAALLYMSYTGYLVKVTDRRAKENFYDAASAMTELQAGIQQAVTESIAEAYREMLIHYKDADFTGADMTAKFQALFQENVLAWELGGERLFTAEAVCKTAVLERFLSRPAQVTALTAGKAEQKGDILLIRDVSVSYTNPRSKLNSTVTADMSISMPAFYSLAAEYTISHVPEFAMIARTALTQNTTAGGLAVQGNAYAGRVELYGSGTTFSLDQGTLICADAVAVTGAGSGGQSRFTVRSNASLWANRIAVGQNGTLALEGRTYVADDLELAGANAAAHVRGRYFGFGNDDSEAGKSSAILINGRNSTLDLSQVNELMLAGHSFVSSSIVTGGEATGQVRMGESISGKTNQQAYLIPPAFLTGAAGNPMVFSGAQPPSVQIKEDVLWTVDNTAKTLQDYHVSVKPVILNRGGAGNRVVYYFMEFATRADANAYFKDYFTVNQAEMTTYLNLYTTLSALGNHQTSVQTSGYTLQKNSDQTYSLRSFSEPGNMAAASGQLALMFERMRRTLSAVNAAAADNPYEYLVKQEALSRITGTAAFREEGGETVALAVNGAYTIDAGTPAGVRIVLASGNVTVNRPFDGLIISGGTIDLKASVYASRDDVAAAFSALNSSGEAFRTLFHPVAGIGGSTLTGTADQHGNWSPDQLVGFQNWTKS